MSVWSMEGESQLSRQLPGKREMLNNDFSSSLSWSVVEFLHQAASALAAASLREPWRMGCIPVMYALACSLPLLTGRK